MPKSFYIIDGHAQIYRAYFAPFRELSSPTGEPTKATFVFTQMLINLVEQRKPDYLAMVIDVGGDEGVFRKQIYPEYKANRLPKPADLPVQETRILQIVRDAGVPIFGQAGMEADDLIATMARKLRDQDYDVFIVSKDKDLRQIMGPGIRMFDVQSGAILDEAKMAADFGYTPAQAIDVQTLMGDTVDNVPGIPGVGEKTAAKLIQKYGSVEGVAAHVDELTPKLRENFLKYQDKLPVSRQLVTLKTDVEFDFTPEGCRFAGLKADGMRPHLAELGFGSLLKRLELGAGGDGEDKPPTQVFRSTLFDHLPANQPASAPAATPPPAAGAGAAAGAAPASSSTLFAMVQSTAADCQYTLVDTEERFATFLAELSRQSRFAFDTETDRLDPMQANLVGMSFSWKHGCGWYIPVRGPLGSQHLSPDRVLPAVKPILEDEKYKKVGHNIKYDLLVMRHAGINLRGIALDSMIAAFLLDASRTQYGIDRLAEDMLNFKKIPTSAIIGSGKHQTSMDRAPLDQVAIYASEDADIALRLADLLEEKLNRHPDIRKLCEDLETPLIEVLADMETNGVAIDPDMLARQSEAMGGRIEELRKGIMKAAECDFNPDSPRQLADVLFKHLKLKVIKRTKTGPSTDVEVLDKLALVHEVPKLILEYRSLMKLKNTYLDNLKDFVNPKTGRIHASFNQIGAATGRLSCSDPNLQNIPIRTDEGRRIRLAFVPYDREHNVLLTADYSQIELRVMAHFTEEPALMKAFAADEDIHAAVAAEVFGVALDKVSKAQRGQAKIINFGIIYGISAYGLARRIDGLSPKAAQELINAYNKRFPSIARFLGECVMHAQAHGYVQTILGRRRPIPDINSGVISIRNGAERMAINSVVQGSAADLIKIAMLNVHRALAADDSPSRMLLQVHDELVFETPAKTVEAEAAKIRDLMTSAMTLKVPLKVEVGWGKNWEEGK